MLIKNGAMIASRILKSLRCPMRNRGASAAIFLGSCTLLCGFQLQAQDLLLKEYIYLDGRLLAVERQVVTLAAQLPANGPDKTTKMASVYSPFQKHASILPGDHRQTAALGIERAPSAGTFQSPVFTGFPDPDDGQIRLVAGKQFGQRSDAYHWNWRASGNLEQKKGGTDEGL